MLGMAVAAQRAQEDEDDERDQDDAEDERVLDVVDRGADGLRAVDGDLDLMAGEMDVASEGSSALTRSMVSMMLAPGWRRMTSTTARLPFTQPATRSFSTSSKTFATSCRRTVVPLL